MPANDYSNGSQNANVPGGAMANAGTGNNDQTSSQAEAYKTPDDVADDRAWAEKMTNEEREYQKMMSDTQSQRARQDLIKAGYNPIQASAMQAGIGNAGSAQTASSSQAGRIANMTNDTTKRGQSMQMMSNLLGVLI